MSDNTTLNSGSGGDTVASDDIGGIKYQRIKPTIGADGTAVDVVPVSNGLDTTATGVPAVGLVAQLDDAATGTVTENQFAPVRMSSRRALLVEGVASGTKVLTTPDLPSGASTAAKQPALGTAGTASSDVITVQGVASMTKLLVTPDSVALPANQSVNVAQLAGTTTDTNSGTKSAGTLRVVIATDQPALTNKLLVTPDSVALPANQSVNVAQINGVTTTMGNGASGTGVQRVTLANDSTGILATVSTVTTVSTLTGGAVAHDGADSGNPVKVGGRAIASPKGITLVAAADRSDLLTDTDGNLLVKGWVTGQDLQSASQSVTDTTSTAVTGFTAVASTKNFVTSVTVYNAHATTNGFLKLQDGSGGTTIWVFPLPATGGTTHNFDPPLKQPTANTALYFASSASITTIYVSVNGFQSKAY